MLPILIKYSSFQTDFNTRYNHEFIQLSNIMSVYIIPLTDCCNRYEPLFVFKVILDLPSMLRQINCVNRDYQITELYGERIKKMNIEIKRAYSELILLTKYYDDLNIKSLWKISQSSLDIFN